MTQHTKHDWIESSADLEPVLEALKKAEFITIDTEFHREKTYYPKLCLIQIATPDLEPVAIDPLAGDLDLAPLWQVLAASPAPVVLHAGSQDLDIFYRAHGTLPQNLFDTQVAAMVLGFGDQISYANLVKHYCDIQIDKGAQFTDWARRPLTSRQLTYALSDVDHLREIYTRIQEDLAAKNRAAWVAEELAALSDPSQYETDPSEVWRKIKTKPGDNGKILAVLKELAAWRELESQRRDMPVRRILRDDQLLELARQMPQSRGDIQDMRGIPDGFARSRYAEAVLEAVAQGLSRSKSERPDRKTRSREEAPPQQVLEMLRLLLKLQCAAHEVAPKMVASAQDVEKLAAEDKPDIPAMKGWRYTVFGGPAQKLKSGDLSLALEGDSIRLIERE